MLRTKLFVACALLLSGPALADSPFDGTWKIVPSSGKFGAKPVSVSLSNGTYRCNTCEIPFSIKADGTYQKRPGAAVDETSVQIVSDKVVKTANRKAGKLTAETLVTLSEDGQSRLVENTVYTPNGVVARSSATQRRVGPSAAGAHALSGEWVTEKVNQLDDALNLVTFKVDGDRVNMSTPDGYSYAATFGGPPVAVQGDRGGVQVQVARLGPNSFSETNMRGGKVLGVNTITVNPDGKGIFKTEDRIRGGADEFELIKN